jgi:hypothetical protein
MPDPVFINHHLYQEGDTYGLVNSVILNKEVRATSPASNEAPHSALIYVDADKLASDPDYQKQVARRQGYFDSQGLQQGSDYQLVNCHFEGQKGLASERRDDGSVHVNADPEIFNSNPRLVSLVLTNAENDPSKQREGLKGKLQGQGVDTDQATSGFKDALAGPSTKFGYISDSTKYLGRVTGTKGAGFVGDTLRTKTMESTAQYSADNEAYLDQFMGKLTERKNLQGAEPGDFFVVLLWIRGARQSELDAIMKEGDGSIGKPQHHTNMLLYKQVRQLVKTVAADTQRPFVVVPIGDELKEPAPPPSATSAALDDVKENFPDAPPGPVSPCVYEKKRERHNLIRFFAEEPFAGKPMGAQMNFLLQLSAKYPVIQVGMRSGSLERLMQVGVPTIYFDRTAKVDGLPNPVGHTRIKDLSGLKPRETKDLAGKKQKEPTTSDDVLSHAKRLSEQQEGDPFTGGFPLMFHVENTDTGVTKYSGVPGTRVDNHLNKVLAHSLGKEDPAANLASYNATKQHLASVKRVPPSAFDSQLGPDDKQNLAAGGLSDQEAKNFRYMLWTVSNEHDRKNGKTQAASPYSTDYDALGARLEADKQAKLDARQKKKLAQEAADDDDDVLGGFPF